MKNQFCSFCGTRHTMEDFPRTCPGCNRITFLNPLPVVVCVQPVIKLTSIFNITRGLLYARRAIQPRHGEWALVGGHIEDGETVEEAALREFKEETSLDMGMNVRITRSYANGKGHVLIACEADYIDHEVAMQAKCCHENSEIGILWQPTELGFPIHTQIVKDWFERCN